MDWITRKWKVLLITGLGLLVVLIAGELFARVYLGLDFPLEFSAENTAIFSNLVTPVAAIISAYLFVRLSQRQQRLAESQNLKPHFEEEFKRVQELLSLPLAVQIPNHHSVTTALNCCDAIRDAMVRLRKFPTFIEDQISFENGVELDAAHYDNRPYKYILEFVTELAHRGVPAIDELQQLASSIHHSPIMRADKVFYLQRISKLLAKDYVNFVEIIKVNNGLVRQYSIPVEDYKSDKMVWKCIADLGFAFPSVQFRYYFLNYLR